MKKGRPPSPAGAPPEPAVASRPEREREDEGPFRIQVVAERAGVPSATLRAWERRYGVPSPTRTSSSYRLYTLEDIERVRTMRKLCESGMAVSEAAKVVLDMHPVIAPPPGDNLVDEVKRRILRASEELDSDRLDGELLRLLYAGDVVSLYERVVGPLLVDIGSLWADGTISVAQEHFLSERIEIMLRNALTMARPQRGKNVLLACVAGEHHVLGLLGAALQFVGWGARPTLLGADTPPEAIADGVARRRPALVGLSVSRVPTRPKTLFEAYARAVDGVPWIVGGEASSELAPIVEQVGGRVASVHQGRWQDIALTMLQQARVRAVVAELGAPGDDDDDHDDDPRPEGLQ